MNSRLAVFALVVGGIVVASQAKRRKRPQALAEATAPVLHIHDGSEVGPIEEEYVSRHGLTLTPDNIELDDWSEWMEKSPVLVKAAILESKQNPEELVTNLLRRLFPEEAWPPEEGSARFDVWNRMVVATGRQLEKPFKPHFEVVS